MVDELILGLREGDLVHDEDCHTFTVTAGPLEEPCHGSSPSYPYVIVKTGPFVRKLSRRTAEQWHRAEACGVSRGGYLYTRAQFRKVWHQVMGEAKVPAPGTQDWLDYHGFKREA